MFSSLPALKSHLIISYPSKPLPCTRTETNNQANRAWLNQNPDDGDPPYAAVACDVAIQTARPKTVEVVMNLEVGENEGNRMSRQLKFVLCDLTSCL